MKQKTHIAPPTIIIKNKIISYLFFGQATNTVKSFENKRIHLCHLPQSKTFEINIGAML